VTKNVKIMTRKSTGATHSALWWREGGREGRREARRERTVMEWAGMTIKTKYAFDLSPFFPPSLLPSLPPFSPHLHMSWKSNKLMMQVQMMAPRTALGTNSSSVVAATSTI